MHSGGPRKQPRARNDLKRIHHPPRIYQGPPHGKLVREGTTKRTSRDQEPSEGPRETNFTQTTKLNKRDIKYWIVYYNREGYETQAFDNKFEVCGGTREALAIRRTLFDRQCSRRVRQFYQYWGMNPLHPAGHPNSTRVILKIRYQILHTS